MSHGFADSALPCFAAFGDQTAENLRERFQPALTHSLFGEYVDRLIMTSMGSAWTRLYDSVRDYVIMRCLHSKIMVVSILFTVYSVADPIVLHSTWL